MRTWIPNLKDLERGLMLAGVGLLAFAAITYVGGRAYSNWAVARFHAGLIAQHGDGQGGAKGEGTVDFGLWSSKRIKAYEATLGKKFDEPLALLKVGKIHLEVPIFEGTDDPALNRGVGRIAGTARIGESGNVGIAGHRDGFFRGLKDVHVGDSIQIETMTGTQTYVIDSITLVGPNDVDVLKKGSGPALTLVTCFPFYFVGSAPQRYIVHASLKDETKTQNEPDKASLQATASRTKEKTQ